MKFGSAGVHPADTTDGADQAAGPAGSDIGAKGFDFWTACVTRADVQTGPIYYDLTAGDESDQSGDEEAVLAWLRRVRTVAAKIPANLAEAFFSVVRCGCVRRCCVIRPRGPYGCFRRRSCASGFLFSRGGSSGSSGATQVPLCCEGKGEDPQGTLRSSALPGPKAAVAR